MIQATLITEGLKIVKSAKSTNGKENRTQNIVNRHRDGEENRTKNIVNRHRDGKENRTKNKVNRHRDGEENGTQNRHRDRGTDKKEKCQEMVQDLIDNKVSIYT